MPRPDGTPSPGIDAFFDVLKTHDPEATITWPDPDDDPDNEDAPMIHTKLLAGDEFDDMVLVMDPITPNLERCGHCKVLRDTHEPDPCLGMIEGVRHACCGHGDDPWTGTPYIVVRSDADPVAALGRFRDKLNEAGLVSRDEQAFVATEYDWMEREVFRVFRNRELLDTFLLHIPDDREIDSIDELVWD